MQTKTGNNVDHRQFNHFKEHNFSIIFQTFHRCGLCPCFCLRAVRKTMICCEFQQQTTKSLVFHAALDAKIPASMLWQNQMWPQRCFSSLQVAILSWWSLDPEVGGQRELRANISPTLKGLEAAGWPSWGDESNGAQPHPGRKHICERGVLQEQSWDKEGTLGGSPARTARPGRATGEPARWSRQLKTKATSAAEALSFSRPRRLYQWRSVQRQLASAVTHANGNGNAGTTLVLPFCFVWTNDSLCNEHFHSWKPGFSQWLICSWARKKWPS